MDATILSISDRSIDQMEYTMSDTERTLFKFGYAAVYLLGTASALLGAALVIASRSTSA
jgi:hypothetical protein